MRFYQSPLSVFLLILPFLLIGCGFHLQGNLTITKFQAINIHNTKPYSLLTEELTKQLKISGVNTHENKKALQIYISQEGYTQNYTNVSANTNVRSYVMSYACVITVYDANGKPLKKPTRLISQQTQFINSNTLLGSNKETFTLYKELRSALVQKIIIYLNNLNNAH